jgi:5-methyltetrahydrofolate--homocysteine methyltransferase
MGDYNMEAYAYELNYAGARLAREACDGSRPRTPPKPRFVVGPSVPLTERSISPSVEDRLLVTCTLTILWRRRLERLSTLIGGWCWHLDGETIFDTLNEGVVRYW